MNSERDPVTHRVRNAAGVVCSFIVVCAFAATGFIDVILTYALGTEIEFPGDWMAAMLSLASASLGFLIGKADKPQSRRCANCGK